jgi:hypothetical protein
MKKLAILLVVLSVSMFTLGCEKPAPEEGKEKPADTPVAPK